MLETSSRKIVDTIDNQNHKVSIVNFERVDQPFSKKSSFEKWETGSQSPRMEFNPQRINPYQKRDNVVDQAHSRIKVKM